MLADVKKLHSITASDRLHQGGDEEKAQRRPIDSLKISLFGC
ncbi:hypothetical protein ADIAL_0140 [Alkalibacterium sp. AK22]|nr:hypothetical protein ADIAL_0140 [Alkalibacterium sp. AK22]